MSRKRKILLVVVLFAISIALLVVGVFAPRNIIPPTEVSDYKVEQIQLENLPANIRAEMEPSLNSGGAFFYRQESGTEVYALLTFGSALGLDMVVSPTQMDGGVYFSIAAIETGETQEHTVYRIYKTDAPAVSADTAVLANPYLKPNSTGMNIGVVRKENDDYYVMPLLDTGTIARVYSASKSLESLDNGIYSFTYTVTPNGAEILTATRQEHYQCTGLVTELVGGPTPRIKVLIGKEKLAFDMSLDQDMVEVFEGFDPANETLRCKLSFTYRDGLKLSSCDILAYAENSEEK